MDIIVDDAGARSQEWVLAVNSQDIAARIAYILSQGGWVYSAQQSRGCQSNINFTLLPLLVF